MEITVTAHKDFIKEIGEYNVISDFVDGSEAAVTKYLLQYESEKASDPGAAKSWANRRARMTNENECDPPLQIHTAHLAQQINFGDILNDIRMSSIIEDVDGFETSSKKMFSNMLKKYLMHGKCGVLVDSPEVINSTLSQAVAANERSYQLLLDATQIRYWDFFRSGAKRGQLSEVIISVDFKNKKEILNRFFFEEGAEFFTKQVLTAKEDGTSNPLKLGEGLVYEVTEQVQGSLSRLPIVLIGAGLEDSVIKKVAQINKALLNDKSILDNILYYQGFQKNIISGARQEELTHMSESMIVLLSNPDAKINTIQAGSPDGIFRRIEMREKRARKTGMFEFNQIVNDSSNQVQSAESKAIDLKSRIAKYDEILDLFAKKLTQIYSLHAEYEGYTQPIAITISRNYGLDDPDKVRADRGIAFSQASQLGVSSVQKQVLKQQVAEMKVIPSAGFTEEEAKQVLMEDIEATEATPSFSAASFLAA